MDMNFKRGTQVRVDNRELARVVSWHPVYGKREDIPGYHPVKFSDGAILMVHESRMAVAG